MSSISATIDLKDDATAIVTNLLRQFPKGSRVRLAISEVESNAPVPGLDEYRQAVAEARRQLSSNLWKTTAEAMKTLREGEDE